MEGKPIGTHVLLSSNFPFEQKKIDPNKKYVLSRFAYTRSENHKVVLESPLSHSLILLEHWIASVILHYLVQPVSIQNLCAKIPELKKTTANEFLSLLLSCQMLAQVTDDGSSVEEEDAKLQSWEFHDFLFHSRSRAGR